MPGHWQGRCSSCGRRRGAACPPPRRSGEPPSAPQPWRGWGGSVRAAAVGHAAEGAEVLAAARVERARPAPRAGRAVRERPAVPLVLVALAVVDTGALLLAGDPVPALVQVADGAPAGLHARPAADAVTRAVPVALVAAAADVGARHRCGRGGRGWGVDGGSGEERARHNERAPHGLVEPVDLRSGCLRTSCPWPSAAPPEERRTVPRR